MPSGATAPLAARGLGGYAHLYGWRASGRPILAAVVASGRPRDLDDPARPTHARAPESGALSESLRGREFATMAVMAGGPTSMQGRSSGGGTGRAASTDPDGRRRGDDAFRVPPPPPPNLEPGQDGADTPTEDKPEITEVDGADDDGRKQRRDPNNRANRRRTLPMPFGSSRGS